MRKGGDEGPDGSLKRKETTYQIDKEQKPCKPTSGKKKPGRFSKSHVKKGENNSSIHMYKEGRGGIGGRLGWPVPESSSTVDRLV